MPLTLETAVVALATLVLDALCLYLICCAAQGARPRLRSYALFTLIIYGVECLYSLLFSLTYTGLAYLSAGLVVLLQARVVYGRRGRALLVATLVNFLAQSGFVAVAAPVGVLLFGAERANAMALSTGYDRLLQIALNSVLALPYCLGVRLVRRGLSRLPGRSGAALHILRALLLLGAGLGCGFVLFNELSDLRDVSRLRSIELLMAALGLMALVCLSYLAQDFRYLFLRRRNDTLERQKAITDALLADARHFRHNALNMLHGFSGTLLTGDAAARAAYYEQLARQCAQLPHANIPALERLDSEALERCLAGHIRQAGDVPLCLLVEKTPRLSAAATRALCQAADILLPWAAAQCAAQAAPCLCVRLTPQGRAAMLEVLWSRSLDAEAPPPPLPLCALWERRGRLGLCRVHVPAAGRLFGPRRSKGGAD